MNVGPMKSWRRHSNLNSVAARFVWFSVARVLLACSLARNRFSLKIVALHTVLGRNWVLAQWFRLMGCQKQSNFVVVWVFFPRNEMRQKVEEGQEGEGQEGRT
jgi:hypothetical protein